MTAQNRSARQTYLDGLSEGRLLYQFDEDTGTAVFYPREVGPGGRAQSLAWRESSGQGVLYSYTHVKSRAGDFNIALVDLDEGFRMMSTIPGVEPTELNIGMRVHALFESDGEEPRVTFGAAA